MRTERYITENPFRLLNVGAELPYSTLRQRAQGAVRAAQVGLGTQVPLEEEFGPGDAKELSETVRALATTPHVRTAYRMMWPLREEGVRCLTSGESTPANSLPPEESNQVLFVSAWCSFIRLGSQEDAAEALERWNQLLNSEEINQRLMSLLVQEDSVDCSTATEQVEDAKDLLEQHLLHRSVRTASEWWEGHRFASSLTVLTIALKSARSDRLQSEVAEPFVRYGQGLDTEVSELIGKMPPYQPGASTAIPEEVTRLEQLAEVLAGIHPSAKEWSTAGERWSQALVENMRFSAISLHNDGDPEGALTIIEAALKRVTDRKTQYRLSIDRRTILKNIEVDKKEQAYKDIKAICATPALYTLNGVGCMLYESNTFEADRRLRFANHYFTVLFIPIFPLGRYLVEREGEGWHFFGKAPWTRSMKGHLAVSCMLLLGVIAYWMQTDPPSEQSGDPGYSASVDSDGLVPLSVDDYSQVDDSGKSSNDLVPSPKIKKETEDQRASVKTTKATREEWEVQLDQLKVELDDLDREIEASESKIKAARSDLERLKATIDDTKPDATNPSDVDAYNVQVKHYEAQRASFNKMVQAHNALVADEKRKVKKHNDLVHKLNGDQ